MTVLSSTTPALRCGEVVSLLSNGDSVEVTAWRKEKPVRVLNVEHAKIVFQMDDKQTEIQIIGMEPTQVEGDYTRCKLFLK